MRSRLLIKCLLIGLALLLLIGQSDRPAHAVGRDQLARCANGAFSTEEDFFMQRGEPVDGNRWISDGDLLSPSGAVCARNADLTRAFSATGAPLPDLGLDAVDLIDTSPEAYLVVFSTELDYQRSPRDPASLVFGAGDLLVTNGIVIPNEALVAAAFATVNQAPYDIGLDEVKLIGKSDDIRRFLDQVKGISRGAWLESPGRLREILAQFDIDIWFSTEGTAQTPNFTPIFLDGDVLSARTGAIVIPQSALFDPPVPAGIPARGVDFGLDAFAVDRFGNRSSLLFSIEISYESDENPALAWTDGDVLALGNVLVMKNNSLISAFNPAVKDLGLDALYFASRDPKDSHIQELCDEATREFDGGDVAIGDPGTGLYMKDRIFSAPKNPRRPCGLYVPIDGVVPAGATKFRVAYRPAGAPDPAVGTAPGIRTEWWLFHRDPAWFNWCYAADGSHPQVLKLETDVNGWMDATRYLQAKLGTNPGYSDGCVNAELRLAVWDSTTAPDPNGHYVVWLEWEDGGGTLHRENADHHIQLDNKAPTAAPGSNDPIKVQVRLPDGVTQVPPCGEVPANVSVIQLWAQFDDPHYWNFEGAIKGGNPPAIGAFGAHNYYDPTDGPPGLKNTNDTGTTPDGTLVRLRDIDMAALLGESYSKCCYLLEIRVWDAALLYNFDHKKVNAREPHYSYQFLTFSAGG